MKLFLIVVVAIGIIHGQRITSGIAPATAYIDQTFVQNCATARKTAICTGCDELSLCLPGLTTPGRVCPAATPYCVRNIGGDSCQILPDQRIAECITAANNNNIMCTSVGIFPDPRRCRIYHECLTIGQRSSVYDCPDEYVFDAAVQGCKLSNSTSDCVTITCNNSQFYQHYGTSTKYYGYCVSADSILILQCADGAVFDGRGCNYICTRTGKFVYSNDPRAYYECLILERRLVSRIIKCQGASIFNATSELCVAP